jgi:prolipoprotein diacylglyceryltransferase
VKSSWLSRCARPQLGKFSTYTVLGFTGYVVASIVGAVLGVAWELSLTERLVVMLVPPVAFLLAVTIATAISGRELIVFFQTTIAGTVAVAALGVALDLRVARLLDVCLVGYGVFLTFGRLGCFAVACCHGRPWRWGVRYSEAHIAHGFWARWRGRTLFPVQLVESAASAALVGIALAVSNEAGVAAAVYALGYSAIRFGLELMRGDVVRPHALGLSEGQWFSLATSVVCVAAMPTAWTIAIAVAMFTGAARLISQRAQRSLHLPPHLRELDHVCDEVLRDPDHHRRDTHAGVAVSVNHLPDGRADWILSSRSNEWSSRTARRIARALWNEPEIQEGRTPGIVHVIVE